MLFGGKNRNLLLVRVHVLLVSAAIAMNMIGATASTVRINEVSDKGSLGACDGEDWIELYNAGTEQVDLRGYVLHDDNGPDGAEAFVFPDADDADDSITIMEPGDLLVLCAGAGSSSTGSSSTWSVPFGIGGRMK